MGSKVEENASSDFWVSLWLCKVNFFSQWKIILVMEVESFAKSQTASWIPVRSHSWEENNLSFLCFYWGVFFFWGKIKQKGY